MRVLDFARDLRGRTPTLAADIVGAAILSSRQFVEKWQREAVGLPADETTLLETALAESSSMGSAAPKGKSTAWRKSGKRELVKSLELVECVHGCERTSRLTSPASNCRWSCCWSL